MGTVRTDSLTDEEIRRFNQDGCLFPISVLNEDQVERLREAINDCISGRVVTTAYELTDPVLIRRVKHAGSKVTFEYERAERSKPHTFPFLFNLWKQDGRFRKVAFDPVIAGMARQLLGTKNVLLMEDNVVIKHANTKMIPWHQDYSYWPLKTPSAVTVWIALDHITAANGAMQVVPGSQRLGERLPVAFGDATPLMKDDRPDITEISQDPAADGKEIITYELRPGECGFHHALVWHSSTPNSTSDSRTAFILRYVAEGTIWLGDHRFPYDEVGVGTGEPLGGPHFPTIATTF